MTAIQQYAHMSLPKQVKQYRITGVLGTGGTSVVAQAIHCATGKSYAVKIIDIRSGLSESLMDSLQREVRVLSRLNHPNIVKLVEVIQDNHFIFLVMEHCEGGTLLNYIIEGKLNDQSETKRLFHQIAKGISYLHSQGISHGDIKPDNIVLTSDCNAKIIDFGYCKECLMGSDSDKSGTIKYAPPELFQSGIYNTQKADIWSLGILLFVMVTGTFPYSTSDDRAVKSLVLHGHMAPPSRIGSEFMALYADMTQRSPRQRPSVAAIVNSPSLATMDPKDMKDEKKDKNGGIEMNVEIMKAQSENEIDDVNLF
jgi:serine/threonine protein kinase